MWWTCLLTVKNNKCHRKTGIISRYTLVEKWRGSEVTDNGRRSISSWTKWHWSLPQRKKELQCQDLCISERKTTINQTHEGWGTLLWQRILHREEDWCSRDEWWRPSVSKKRNYPSTTTLIPHLRSSPFISSQEISQPTNIYIYIKKKKLYYTWPFVFFLKCTN